MDTQSSRISDDPQAGSGFTYPEIRGAGFAVLHGSNEAAGPSQNLFGENEKIVNCLYCKKRIFNPRINQVVHGECRTPYRKQREAAEKQAKMTTREREALAWIKENFAIVMGIASQVQTDFKWHPKKLGFREYWERARRVFPEITFDNNHTRFVSRYIMEQYPDLAGVFRTRS
jgi:hypothetical protein